MTCLQTSEQSLGSNLLHLQMYQIFSTFLIEWFAILGINFKITYLQIKSFSLPEVGNCLLPHTELHRCLDMRKINCSQNNSFVIEVVLHKNLFMDLICMAGVLFLWTTTTCTCREYYYSIVENSFSFIRGCDVYDGIINASHHSCKIKNHI